jgi:hypothetical protein
MTPGNRNRNSKRLFSKNALHHLKAAEYETERHKISSDHKAWDFRDFVDRALKVILILRIRDKEKYNQRQK